MFSKLLLMFVFPVTCVVAHEHVGQKEQSVPTIMQIAYKQPESIQHYDDGKLYLKAEKIYQTVDGPLLYSNGSTILLPNLSVDQSGYYLSCRRRMDDYQLKCPNPDCGMKWWFSETWSIYCPACGMPGE